MHRRWVAFLVELLDLATGHRRRLPGDGSQFIRMAVTDDLLITRLAGQAMNVQVVELDDLHIRPPLPIRLATVNRLPTGL